MFFLLISLSLLKLLNAIILSFKAFLEENFLSEIKTQKPAEIKPADVTAKVDLKKSNPKEYYASSSISFKDLSRNSQKLSDDIQKLSSQIETGEAKIASLKAVLNTKKELFGIVSAEINKRIQGGRL